MYLFHLLRSFLPLHNPIGFGASDFIELAFAALLVGLTLARGRIEPVARRLAESTGWSMLLLALLPVALRLALLPHHPVPTPSGSDDFSHLLIADTLAHLRLANPPHSMRRFFEAIFVLQDPSYSSIFPVGQGLAMALGRVIFRTPWAGVVLSVSALCTLCYWMLRAWTTPGWALTGGLLAVCEFGPLSSWMNGYWGGAVSAAAGCLVFGSLPRLRAAPRTRDAVLLGAGLGLQLLARPYESLLLLLCAILFLGPALGQRALARAVAMAALVTIPAISLTLLQNMQVTGSWTTLPYLLSRYQYGVPTTFTVQPNPQPHRPLTAEQQLDYEAQASVHGSNPETLGSYLERLAFRTRFYRFFFLAPLYVALPLFLFSLGESRFAWVGVSVLVFALGANFYPYFYPHYIAAITCLLLLAGVTALDRLSRLPVGREIARLIVFLCVAHFLFWYGLHALGDEDIRTATRPFETWDVINSGDPEGRIAVNERLAQSPGKQLVFVHYWPQHRFHEWIGNEADIDRARVVWAGDLGAAENEQLRRYYPDRTTWLIEPDAHPPRLTPYQSGNPEVPAATLPARSEPANPKPAGAPPPLRFEPVPEAKDPPKDPP
jgi:hypothetical protein